MTSTANKPGVREAMPLLAANEGVWEGWYRYYDAKTGELVDQHRSRLICRLFNKDGVDHYHQTNYYFWDDGRVDIRDFPAEYRDGRIWWDNDLIKGWAAAMQPDDFNRSTCLNWTRKDEPGIYLYEMIQNNDARTHRARTWQWFRDGICYQRTLIDEKFITPDWQNWSNDGPPTD
ncbi:DUF3598 domain-containing protein [Novosphingobium sp. YJ-S2-02]|uniref:DUF3598 domain-containing protein n=1 Tax=Novosphingobium aureum TaxID=2792964 RepID=A0A931MLA8_9SPHN|nr:DUF3598 domain-containing protein [Novosphingobium aureum]MBH0113289.1 DUF3598 domain-containing protein [Novosphingobium aureum]